MPSCSDDSQETPPVEVNICGVLVHAKPNLIETVSNEILNLPGTEIPQTSAEGRLVVIIEDTEGHWAGDTITLISNIEGVLPASLVFHQRDTLEGDETGSQEVPQ